MDNSTPRKTNIFVSLVALTCLPHIASHSLLKLNYQSLSQSFQVKLVVELFMDLIVEGV